MKERHLTVRLPADLAAALRRLARARGHSKSQVAREAVARYLGVAPADDSARRLSARALAERWSALPALTREEAEALEADLEASRKALPGFGELWP
jgi:predicted transcriptional regulator